jgi:transcriptional regulator with XRE-family HTH domain
MTRNAGQIQVGERIRQFRTTRGLSVRTLAAQSGFTPGFISQVENGQASPSIASLERIAAVLGVTLAGFFTEPAPSPATVVRATDRQELTSLWSRATIEALGPADNTRTLASIMITLAPGGRSGTRPHPPLGEQFALVCAGVVTLTLPAGIYTLEPGDAVSLAPEIVHQWENTGTDQARLLIVSARKER